MKIGARSTRIAARRIPRARRDPPPGHTSNHTVFRRRLEPRRYTTADARRSRSQSPWRSAAPSDTSVLSPGARSVDSLAVRRRGPDRGTRPADIGSTADKRPTPHRAAVAYVPVRVRPARRRFHSEWRPSADAAAATIAIQRPQPSMPCQSSFSRSRGRVVDAIAIPDRDHPDAEGCILPRRHPHADTAE